MKNKELYKLLKISKANSGFTLIELLVGLFMSIFVIGALGFGLMQVLGLTQSEGSKTAARNETGRALDFISDELKSAQAVAVDMTDTNITVIAPGFTKPAGADVNVRLALQIPGVFQRVIYYVAPPRSGSPWKGPLVIYRWGPDLTANGSYVTDASSAGRVNNPAGWTHEALIDKIDDALQSQNCDVNNDGVPETINYKGFFACVVDNDGDKNAAGNLIIENLTDTNADGVIDNKDTGAVDKNGDGVINNEDGADVDGKSITAQLFFTGETITVSGQNTDSYSADTQTVARARTAPANNSEDFKSYTMSFRTLNPSFACKIDSDWQMRTDFGESLANPGSVANWNHEENRQPQPIKISGNKLVISSAPRAPKRKSDGSLLPSDTICDNRRSNNGREADITPERNFSGNVGLGESENWAVTGKENVVAISQAINFEDPRTFNGDPSTCTSYPCTGSTNGKVYSQKTDAAAAENTSVAMLKYGSVIPNQGGYDVDGVRNYDLVTGNRILAAGDQPSLGEFLFSKGLATKTGTGATATYTVNDQIKPDERIIGFEIGQTDTTKPGFDLQDNIFVVSSDAFKQKYSKYKESYLGHTAPATLPDYDPSSL